MLNWKDYNYTIFCNSHKKLTYFKTRTALYNINLYNKNERDSHGLSDVVNNLYFFSFNSLHRSGSNSDDQKLIDKN